MTTRKRTQSATKLLGAKNSATRAALIQAVEELMLEEGYAAVTARKVAARLGMTHQVIYYYFDTIEDLLLAVFRQTAEQGYARLTEVLESEQPLRALWALTSDPRGTRWNSEFMALANHNPVIRAEIAKYANKQRAVQEEALSRHFKARGIEPQLSPALLAILMGGLARTLAHDLDLEIDRGHAEAEALVEECLRRFENAGEAAQARRAVEGD